MIRRSITSFTVASASEAVSSITRVISYASYSESINMLSIACEKLLPIDYNEIIQGDGVRAAKDLAVDLKSFFDHETEDDINSLSATQRLARKSLMHLSETMQYLS